MGHSLRFDNTHTRDQDHGVSVEVATQACDSLQSHKTAVHRYHSQPLSIIKHRKACKKQSRMFSPCPVWPLLHCYLDKLLQ